MKPDLKSAIENDGFAIVPDVLHDSDIDDLTAALNFSDKSKNPAQRRGGRRNLLDIPAIQELCRSIAIRNFAEAVLGPNCFATRGVLFDKTPDANWKVVWHQDVMIALRERRAAPEFSAWSQKAGVPHARPPVSVLERMLSVRLHLDSCGEENGPLRVIPGSHRDGLLDDETQARWKENSEAETCLAPRGGVLLMRPLLLHASSAATTPSHRRVVHLDFAADNLPHGLEWHRRI